MKNGKKILIIGLFSKNTDSRQYLTAPEQLADLFEKNNVPVIKTAYSINKIPRLVHTITTILTSRNQFDVAIAPLYGSSRSFYLQVITSRLLKMLNKKLVLTVHGGSIPERMQKDPSLFLRSLKLRHACCCIQLQQWRQDLNF